MTLWNFDNTTESKAPGSFDYGKHQNTVMRLGSVMLMVSDPDVIQDMLVAKNA